LCLGRNHLLVQDADYADSFLLDSIEHYMFSHFKPMQICLDGIAASAHGGMIGQKLKRIFQLPR
jgi:hypothetical protein